MISDETGIIASTIAGYYSGSIIPKDENLMLLCACLDVSADYLIGLTDDPKPHGRNGKYGYIVERIRFLMERYHMTQNGFCKRIGTSKSSAYLWLTRKKGISLYSVTKIAEAFGVRADWLIGLSDDMGEGVKT